MDKVLINTDRFQRIAKALADPRRFDILEMIAAGGEMCCREVVERLPVAQATVSHHLKELAEAGLIETRCEGQFKYLRARPEMLTQYVKQLSARVGVQQIPRAKTGSKRTARMRKA